MKRLVALLLLAGVVAYVLLRDGGAPAKRSDPQGSLPEREAPVPEPEPGRAAPRDFADLLAQEPGAATEDAAAALRRLLRTDPDARREAEARLLADDTPRELRMALGLVLGTLPGSDPVLREALAKFRGDLEVARCLVFALGATREPLEDDEVFGLGDRPWGVHGPQGLGITVRRLIEDAETRALLEQCLADERGGLREAAAIALRHTLSDTGVRSSFLATLGGEASDDVALVLGESLAGWAGRAPEGAERIQVVAALLARAGDDALDGYRFRMEDDFARLTLDDAAIATLAEYASPSRPFAVRSFGLTALAAAAPETARSLLEEFATREREVPVRDLSARLLGTLPLEQKTLEVLARISREDEAWNVRYQAVEALARHKDEKTAAAALQAATADPDERVAKRARAALQ